MNRICKGCGALLQSNDPKLIGYTPKKEAEVCQRCFRLTHYNDVMVSMQQGIDETEMMKKINKLDALVCWVVDLFDFEAGMKTALNRHLAGKDILLIATKRDLLPWSMGNQKLAAFIMKRARENQLNVKGVVCCFDIVKNGLTDDNESVYEVAEAIEHLRNGKDVVFAGMANAGKSSLLNALLKNNQLTVSAHPGTTLDMNPIQLDGFTLYDTPGFVNRNSVLTYLNPKDLKTVIPQKAIKPKVYQLTKNQSLSLGGLARIDLEGCENVSAAVYVSNELLIHRSKSDHADELWEKHLNEMLVPSITEKDEDMKKIVIQDHIDGKDICIPGVGFVCIHGKVNKVSVTVDSRIDVQIREAMI